MVKDHQFLGGAHYGSGVVVRLLLAILGVVLLWWAYVILDNIWSYNDSGTVAYVTYALVPGVPGVLCLYWAIRRRRST